MGRGLHFLQLELKGLGDFELGVVRAEARGGTQLLWTGRGRQKMEPGGGVWQEPQCRALAMWIDTQRWP